MGKLKDFFSGAKKIVTDSNPIIQKTPIKILETVIKTVYDAYDRTREYIHDKKMARKAKREAEARELQQQFQEQNQNIQKKQQQSSYQFAESFGDESYDVQSSNAYEIRHMSQELEKIRGEFRSNAEDIERKIIDFVQDSIKDMIKEFEEINSQQIGTSSINLNISYLKSLESQIELQITGFIQNSVKRRLSIDSEECADILRMEGKNKKRQAMQDYQNRIFNDAINSLWDMINDSICSQNELIYTQISNRLNAMEIAANESMAQLEEIKSAKEQNVEEITLKQNEYQKYIDIASWCIDELEREETA